MTKKNKNHMALALLDYRYFPDPVELMRAVNMVETPVSIVTITSDTVIPFACLVSKASATLKQKQDFLRKQGYGSQTVCNDGRIMVIRPMPKKESMSK